MALDPARVRALAAECGLQVATVGPADPFLGLADLLEGRVRAGYMHGLDWFTVDRARFSSNPHNLLSSARSIVSVGIPYRHADVVPPPDDVPRGRIARYAWGRDYHRTLRARMEALHRRLEGEAGRPIEARLLVDTARIVDRAAAARSGLGWYGKNTMVLVPHHGSWVMLGELLVDLEIEPDAPLRPRCGRCTGCLDACPTGALVDAYTLDTPRCISFLTIELRGSIPRELRSQLGDWVFGCDVCQEVCPYTAAALPSREPTFQPERVENAFPPLHWLLRMSEDEFRSTYRGTAVLRTKRAGLARNAAVALGNVGTAADLALLEEVVVCHDEPLVRGHAAWALARLDPQGAAPFLVRRLSTDPDPEVRAEIADALGEAPFVAQRRRLTRRARPD
ncbi:MAG TPA: tRNA epoxyqueuosine(34) reductase QueG [Thermomicrobiaceae bacterium]|nr:tRNA epoxyqueuosine(34) reductase QueG [Thermomicrobiaceae bacterium]